MRSDPTRYRPKASRPWRVRRGHRRRGGRLGPFRFRRRLRILALLRIHGGLCRHGAGWYRGGQRAARRRADATVYDAGCVRTSIRARRRRAAATGHGAGCVARAPSVRAVSGSVVPDLVAADRRRDRDPLRRVRVDGRAAVSMGPVVDPVGVGARDVAVVRAQRVRARRGRPQLGDLRPEPWDRRLPADRGVRTPGVPQRAHAAGARACRLGRVSGVPPADLAVLARGPRRPAASASRPTSRGTWSTT